ncbi:hypothetical protein J6590_061230 [Homalodisca vitripennis]|nr:hypothetical protein J6590_061230 [Homalodisca vitripennis]
MATGHELLIQGTPPRVTTTTSCSGNDTFSVLYRQCRDGSTITRPPLSPGPRWEREN